MLPLLHFDYRHTLFIFIMVEEHKTVLYSNRKQEDGSVPLFLSGYTGPIEEEFCCSAHSTLVSDQNTEFVSLPLHGNVVSLKGVKFVSWPSKTNVACWYDTYPFDTTPFPLVHHYDEQKRAFVIYGNVCSPQCALAYMHREGRQHDLWERVVLFGDMMHQVFQVKVSGCEPAPPFLTLSRFGGFYSIEDYRASFTTKMLTVITPPFIMYPLVIQEKHKTSSNSESVHHAVVPEETVLSTGHVLRGLRRPTTAAATAAATPAATPTPTPTPTPTSTLAPIPAATGGAMTVEALHLSSSDEEDQRRSDAVVVVPALQDVLGAAVAPTTTTTTTAAAAPLVVPGLGVASDREFYTRLTKGGRGRGRGKRTAALAPSAPLHEERAESKNNNTMLTSFLVVGNKK